MKRTLKISLLVLVLALGFPNIYEATDFGEYVEIVPMFTNINMFYGTFDISTTGKLSSST